MGQHIPVNSNTRLSRVKRFSSSMAKASNFGRMEPNTTETGAMVELMAQVHFSTLMETSTLGCSRKTRRMDLVSILTVRVNSTLENGSIMTNTATVSRSLKMAQNTAVTLKKAKRGDKECW